VEVVLLESGDRNLPAGFDRGHDVRKLGIHVVDEENAEGADRHVKKIGGKSQGLHISLQEINIAHMQQSCLSPCLVQHARGKVHARYPSLRHTSS
jgi:hypothetical protein